MEWCVHSQLLTYLESHDFISPDQSAYLKNNSTQTALLKVTNEWYHNIENGLITGVCFLDVSKCFDAISHEVLLFKVSKYGISNLELDWFKSYLKNRSQATCYNQILSPFHYVNTGVPQGSILGPLFFLLFINDLPMYVNNCNLYAHDAMTEATGSTVEDVIWSLKRTLISLI